MSTVPLPRSTIAPACLYRDSCISPARVAPDDYHAAVVKERGNVRRARQLHRAGGLELRPRRIENFRGREEFVVAPLPADNQDPAVAQCHRQMIDAAL